MTDHGLPRRVAGVQASDGLLRDAHGAPLCRVNATATAIWELCDGGTRPAEMAEAISDLAGLATGDAAEQVEIALLGLRAAGAIEWVEVGVAR
jgi:hypothetical protein